MKTWIAAAVLAAATLALLPARADNDAPSWFRALDKDRNGVVGLDELHHARYQKFARLDADRDGRLSPAELKAERAWLSRFAWFDTDHDGRISIEEYETKGLARFALLDRDGDGRITLPEALQIIEAQAAIGKPAG